MSLSSRSLISDSESIRDEVSSISMKWGSIEARILTESSSNSFSLL